jgi:hypothetical protein
MLVSFGASCSAPESTAGTGTESKVEGRGDPTPGAPSAGIEPFVPAPRENAPAIRPERDGRYVLRVEEAELTGAELRLERVAGTPELVGWTDVADQARWTLWIDDPGPFDVELVLTADVEAPTTFQLEVAEQRSEYRLVASPRSTLAEILRFDVPLSGPGLAAFAFRVREGRLPVREIVLRPVLRW